MWLVDTIFGIILALDNTGRALQIPPAERTLDVRPSTLRKTMTSTCIRLKLKRVRTVHFIRPRRTRRISTSRSWRASPRHPAREKDECWRRAKCRCRATRRGGPRPPPQWTSSNLFSGNMYPGTASLHNMPFCGCWRGSAGPLLDAMTALHLREGCRWWPRGKGWWYYSRLDINHMQVIRGAGVGCCSGTRCPREMLASSTREPPGLGRTGGGRDMRKPGRLPLVRVKIGRKLRSAPDHDPVSRSNAVIRANSAPPD